MKTVVGVIESHAEAEHIVQELVMNGFTRDEIKMVYEEKVSEQEAAQQASADLKDLHTALLEAGMPDAAAKHYEEEIHHGKTLITVHASDDMAMRACDIIEEEAEEVEEYDLGGEEMAAESAMPIEAAPRTEIEPVSSLESARAAHLGSAGAAMPSATEEMSAASTHGVDATQDIEAERVEPAQQQGEKMEEIKVPIVEERLKVGKREAEAGGVRIEPQVKETPVEEGVTLRREEVKVERIPADRPATEADLEAAARGPVELREYREEAVVEKEARVVGEVRVTKEASEHEETVRDTVRTTDVNVDELMADYRNQERFRGRQFADVEPELQSEWETRRPGTWERFKDSVRNAWNRT